MKKLKKIMCTTLASTMMLGLVACGDGDAKGMFEDLTPYLEKDAELSETQDRVTTYVNESK